MYYKADNCIIPPHARPGYEKVKNYPKNILVGHSVRWPKIITDLQKELPGLNVRNISFQNPHEDIDFEYNLIPMKYVFSPEGALGIQTQIIKHAMRGAKNIVNVGCVGGIKSHYKKGSIVVCSEAIRDSGFGHNLATDDEKATTSEKLNHLLLETSREVTGNADYVKVWCVDTLYYTYDRLAKILSLPHPPDIVEMEMEAGAITTNWLNANYFKNDPIHYAHLGYISDILPLTPSQWVDPFHPLAGEMLIPWKKQAFEVTVKSLERNEKRNTKIVDKIKYRLQHPHVHIH